MSHLLPISRMHERLDIARNDSDTTLFLDLLYFGEMIIKLITACFVSTIEDDRERHCYRLLYNLVRANSLGEWTQALDDALIGPASQHMMVGARDDQREVTQKCAAGEWQYNCYSSLFSVIKAIEPKVEPMLSRVSMQNWFTGFVNLRNITRGHGATTSSICSEVCPSLEESITLICDNLHVLNRSWAYLHRNLSGKYRVIPLGGDTDCFDYLKKSSYSQSSTSSNLQNGVYVFVDGPIHVELVVTDADASDFFFPNGSFGKRKFEMLSYLTDSRLNGDSSPYLATCGELPPSETQGLSSLSAIGNSFTNLPPMRDSYISRQSLESDLYRILSDDRHPVITLTGRGGIGKTSLALAVLHQLAKDDRFGVILWFSSRDVDLLPTGPKSVKPHVLSEEDISEELVGLFSPSEAGSADFDSRQYLGDTITKSPIDYPILFVFDNFETVANPTDLFSWLDSRVRLPNKILITTRFRDFRADYPIEVSGMTEDEANQLISNVSSQLGISKLITSKFKEELYTESDGHPYVMKVLLGETAKAGHAVKVKRIAADKEEMLVALFERTYAGLSPVAKRVFLTLCSWHSYVPQLALEAVLLRPTNERMDVQEAIEELLQSSFIEDIKVDGNEIFLVVPLVTSVFGKSKLSVSSDKYAIDADIELLRVIGATKESGVGKGIQPRIEQLFRYVAKSTEEDPKRLEENLPILEYICNQYPRGWLLLASLYEESDIEEPLEKAKDSIRRFIERSDDASLTRGAWEHLAEICSRTGDWIGQIHALVEMCQQPGEPFNTLSNAADKLNRLAAQMKQGYKKLDSEEKERLILELIKLMEARIKEANATDLSRLAWLHMQCHDEKRASELTNRGLELDHENTHCLNLAKRLKYISS